MQRIPFVLLFLLIFSVSICAQDNPDPGWKTFALTDFFLYQYSADQMTRTSQGTLIFQVKISPTVEGLIDLRAREEVITYRRNSHQSIKGYERWGHSLIQYEVQCSQRKYRVLSWADYKETGSKLDSQSPTGDWRDVDLESVAGAMLTKVCNSK
jgi:hypothetical protein